MSDRIVWKDAYKIGIDDIDKQHHKLFSLLADLEEAVHKGLEDSKAGSILKELVAYTQTHFKDEEALMEKIHYPELQHHATLHKNLIHELKQILLTIRDHSCYTARNLVEFMKHWIIDHILQEDLKLGHAHEQAVATKTVAK